MMTVQVQGLLIKSRVDDSLTVWSLNGLCTKYNSLREVRHCIQLPGCSDIEQAVAIFV